MRTLSADVRGTITDLVLIDGEAGAVHLDKVPSTPDGPPFRREPCRTVAGLTASGLGDDHVP